MLNLENVYFYTIKENAVIFKMSKESLDEFLSENSLSVHPEYKEAELHLTFNDTDLKEAILIPIYEDETRACIDVMKYITEELIEDSLEEMAEDSESFSKNLDDFYKF